MGLSNEERIRKVIFSLREITNLVNDAIPDDYNNKQKKLFSKCKKLWRPLLSKKGDSAFWIFGSDNNVGFSTTTLFSIALYEQITNAKVCSIKSTKKEINDEFSDSEYNYFSNRLSVNGFTSTNNSKINDIYYLCQHIQYAANRYNDDLSKSFIPLLNQISDILGIIFDIFISNDDFAKAWLFHEISRKFYTEGWLWKKKSEQDNLIKFMLKHNIHHYFLTNISLLNLKEILKSLTIDNSNKNRLRNLLLCVKHTYSLSLYKKELQSLCKEYKYPWIAAKKIIEKNQKMEAKHNEVYTKSHERDKKWEREDLLGIEHKYD